MPANMLSCPPPAGAGTCDKSHRQVKCLLHDKVISCYPSYKDFLAVTFNLNGNITGVMMGYLLILHHGALWFSFFEWPYCSEISWLNEIKSGAQFGTSIHSLIPGPSFVSKHDTPHHSLPVCAACCVPDGHGLVSDILSILNIQSSQSLSSPPPRQRGREPPAAGSPAAVTRWGGRWCSEPRSKCRPRWRWSSPPHPRPQCPGQH